MKNCDRCAQGDVPGAASGAGGLAYWVYVLRCADGTLYTGVARDLDRRVAEHNGARRNGARYTASRRPVQVVYRRQFPNRSQAQQEEARVKAMTRLQKEHLIEGTGAQT